MALYHVHRPQDYEELIGQEYIVQTLSNQVASGKIAHAYLFSGPRGVGKTTTARILSKAVNCTNRKDGESNPCNTCTSCQEITAGNSIDVIEIDAASNTGVDNVRTNIIDNAQFRPTKSKYKIFIIDEVHMLSTSAFNALLKIMEEPPSHIMFILATTELQKIPDTIISRCQRFQFKRVPYELMKAHILSVAKKEDYEIDESVVDRIILKSDGCVRDGMSLLDQLMALGTKKISQEIAMLVLPTANKEQILAFLEALLKKNAQTSLRTLDTIIADHNDLVSVADDIIDMLRHIMILQADPAHKTSTIELGQETVTTLTQLGKNCTGKEIVRIIDLLSKRRYEIKSAALPQLPLELAIIEWCDTNQSTTDLPTPTPKPSPAKVTPTSDPIQPVQPIKKIIDKPKITPEPITEIPLVQPENIIEPVETAEAQDDAPPADSAEQKTISKHDIEKVWTPFMAAVEKYSPSLVFILKMADVISVEKNMITLSVPYSFHQDKLMDPKCREPVQKILSDIMATKVQLNVILIASKEEKKDELNDLASLVGGEVVE